MVDRSSHIRQLLALALYPPVPVTDVQPRPHSQSQKRPTTPTKPVPTRSRPHNTTTSVPPPLSPRKLQEQTEIPSGRASQLALDLLLTLSNTTRPAHLVAGLTSYARPACDVELFDGMVRTGKVDGSKNPLVREAVAVGRAKDCWAMLRPGFSTRKVLISSRTKNQDDYDDEEGEDSEGGMVASHAWGVLQWWTRLFEVDQAEHELEQGSGMYTPIRHPRPSDLTNFSSSPCLSFQLHRGNSGALSLTHPTGRPAVGYTRRARRRFGRLQAGAVVPPG